MRLPSCPLLCVLIYPCHPCHLSPCLPVPEILHQMGNPRHLFSQLEVPTGSFKSCISVMMRHYILLTEEECVKHVWFRVFEAVAGFKLDTVRVGRSIWMSGVLGGFLGVGHRGRSCLWGSRSYDDDV